MTLVNCVLKRTTDILPYSFPCVSQSNEKNMAMDIKWEQDV